MLGVLELEALGVLEVVSVLELELLEVEPPEAELDFSLSFSASVVAELPEDGLVALEDEELGELGGVVALGDVALELELEPALGELDGGIAGVVEDELLAEPEGAGAVDVRSRPRSSPQAARPRAKATATANVESLMGYSKVGYEKERSKLRAGCKPLIDQGPLPACRTLCPVRGSSYLLPDGVLPEGLEEEPEDEPDGAPEGLVERFCCSVWLGLLVVEPGEAVLPPDAARLSRSHPASSAPESANETAATNAVTFMLTSVVGVLARSNLWTNPSSR